MGTGPKRCPVAGAHGSGGCFDLTSAPEAPGGNRDQNGPPYPTLCMNRSIFVETARLRPRAANRLILFLVIFPFAGCSTPPAPAGAAPAAAALPPDRASVPAEPAPITAGRAPERPGPYAPGVDVLHYDVELALDEDGDRIWGRTDVQLRRTAEVGTVVALDLTGLAVTAVEVDGSAHGYRHERGRLILEPTPPPGPLRVRISYRGVPDDGLILGRNVHGAPTVFADNWPNRARFWFPAVDHPSDKATVRFTVHAPAGWQVIANGELDSDPAPSDPAVLAALGHGPSGPSGAHRTWVWSTSVDIPTYTMVVGAADFHVRSVGLAACGNAPASRRADGCVDVSTWVFPPDSVQGARIFRRADRMVDFFTEVIGPFPYEKLANVQSATRFGGMENAAAIFYSERAISSGTLGEGTVSHEIAHQWFGDSVTEALWSHLWLSEGFATYFGALFFERADGVDSFREIMDASRRTVLGSAVVRARPVLDDDPNLFALLNDNNYPKGGWVLHMLRGVLGDQVFFPGIREYYRRYRDGIALTDDFRTVMEEAAGRELGWFFDQWLRAPGYPVLAIDWSWDDDASQVEIVIEQVQVADWPTYRLPATVEIRSGSGNARHRVELTARREVIRLDAAGPPTEVRFDPDGWILAELR